MLYFWKNHLINVRTSFILIKSFDIVSIIFNFVQLLNYDSVLNHNLVFISDKTIKNVSFFFSILCQKLYLYYIIRVLIVNICISLKELMIVLKSSSSQIKNQKYDLDLNHFLWFIEKKQQNYETIKIIENLNLQAVPCAYAALILALPRTGTKNWRHFFFQN